MRFDRYIRISEYAIDDDSNVSRGTSFDTKLSFVSLSSLYIKILRRAHTALLLLLLPLLLLLLLSLLHFGLTSIHRMPQNLPFEVLAHPPWQVLLGCDGRSFSLAPLSRAEMHGEVCFFCPACLCNFGRCAPVFAEENKGKTTTTTKTTVAGSRQWQAV